jgi:hypothetical protein
MSTQVLVSDDQVRGAVEAAAGAIIGRTYSFANESRLQDAIQVALEEIAPGVFLREASLGRKSRPDFFAPYFGIAIEIKTPFTGGSPAEVMRQLLRYSALPDVRHIVLVSSSHRIATTVPPMIGGKPVKRVSLIGNAFT